MSDVRDRLAKITRPAPTYDNEVMDDVVESDPDSWGAVDTDPSLSAEDYEALFDAIVGDEDDLTAAGWEPEEHPRGNDGRFIEAGAVVDLLKKAAKDLTANDVDKAVDDILFPAWTKMKPEQRQHIRDSVAKLSVKTVTKNWLKQLNHHVSEEDDKKSLAQESGKTETPKAAPKAPVKPVDLANAFDDYDVDEDYSDELDDDELAEGDAPPEVSPDFPLVEGDPDKLVTGDTSWTETEQNAAYRYTDHHYEEINGYLRDGGDISADNLKTISAVRGMMQPTSRNMTVFRRTYADAFGKDVTAANLEKMVGTEFDNKGFTSTSLSRSIVDDYYAGDVVMHIEVPKGTKALYVGDMTANESNDLELVLANSTHFKITKVEKVGDHTTVATVRVVGQSNDEKSATKAAPTGKPVVPAIIYKKNPDGFVVAESPDGKKRMRWDAGSKKFVVEDENGKQLDALNKTSAYAAVKDSKRWVEPGQAPSKPKLLPSVKKIGAPGAVSQVASVADAEQLLSEVTGDDERAEYTRRALNGLEEFGPDVATTYISRDENGKLTGAMTIVDHTGEEEGAVPYSVVDYVGALGNGAGTDLVRQAIQHGLDRDSVIYAEPTPGSVKFWEHMGFHEDPLGEGTPFYGLTHDESIDWLENGPKGTKTEPPEPPQAPEPETPVVEPASKLETSKTSSVTVESSKAHITTTKKSISSLPPAVPQEPKIIKPVNVVTTSGPSVLPRTKTTADKLKVDDEFIYNGVRYRAVGTKSWGDVVAEDVYTGQSKLMSPYYTVELPGLKTKKTGSLTLQETLDEIGALNEVARPYIDIHTEVSHAYGTGKIVNKFQAEEHGNATEALRKIRAESEPLAMSALELLAQRDGSPWGSVDTQADSERWGKASKPDSIVDFGADKAKLQKIRDEYVVNDPKTIKMNSELRQADPSAAAKAWRGRVDRLTTSSQIAHDSLVYRGAAFYPEMVNQLRPGAVLHTPGPMSTDMEKSNAEFYANTRIDRVPGALITMFTIRVPKGTRGADVDYGEFVFPSNTGLRIVSSEIVNGVVNIVADMVPPAKKGKK